MLMGSQASGPEKTNSQQIELTRPRNHTGFETVVLHNTLIFFILIMNTAIDANRSMAIFQSLPAKGSNNA